jgi:hypothetical protein
MKEIWKDIEGFEKSYQISNLGRFKSFKYKEERILKKGNAMGYEIIRLFKDKKIFTLKAHRLVASHFLDNINEKEEVNHKNGNKKDNSVSNLEWTTKSENLRHAILTGLKSIKKGELHGRSKLKEDQVKKIKYELNHLENSQLANLFNVDRSTIYMIKENKNWKHI